jgi:hypothetical protein
VTALSMAAQTWSPSNEAARPMTRYVRLGPSLIQNNSDLPKDLPAPLWQAELRQAARRGYCSCLRW